MAWTDEQIDALRRLWGEGLSTSEIGRQLGVSKNAVVGKAHRLGLPSRPSPIKRAAATTPARAARKTVALPKEAAPKGPTCQWPLGHPNEPGFRFCGKPSLPGKPYCQEHYDVAYIPAQRRERRVR